MTLTIAIATIVLIIIDPQHSHTIVLIDPHYSHTIVLIEPHYSHTIVLIDPHYSHTIVLIDPHYSHTIVLIDPHHDHTIILIDYHHSNAIVLIDPHTSDSPFRPNVAFKKKFTVNVLCEAIDKLNVGIGHDRVHSNHLKFMSFKMISIMCDLFNSCLIHNYVPKCMVAGVIRPCIKNKIGNVLDSKQLYREIMISSNMYKVFEKILLPLFSSHLQISSHQFTYRRDTLTILATSFLKENISKFLFDGSVVYSCFLNLS